MSSIFSIPIWNNTINYFKNDIVKVSNIFYYALKDVPVGSPLSPFYFGGYSNYVGKTKPLFLWSPSFNSNITTDINIKITKFDEGFEQRAEDGINSDSLEINLIFEKRTDREAKAIVHFLYSRGGDESFFYTPPAPYEKNKIFICTEWQHSCQFVNNNNITAKFIEKFE